MEEINKWEALTELVGKTQSVAYIKLIKNTKGYNWEIKQLSLDLDQLEEINTQMITKFGGQE